MTILLFIKKISIVVILQHYQAGRCAHTDNLKDTRSIVVDIIIIKPVGARTKQYTRARFYFLASDKIKVL